jgi:hypothetical protein
MWRFRHAGEVDGRGKTEEGPHFGWQKAVKAEGSERNPLNRLLGD